MGLFRELLVERAVPGIYVTHDPREAVGLGDRLAILAEGAASARPCTRPRVARGWGL
jgi:ABC-type proline/glycine betaine transport system ATPase subunit